MHGSPATEQRSEAVRTIIPRTQRAAWFQERWVRGRAVCPGRDSERRGPRAQGYGRGQGTGGGGRMRVSAGVAAIKLTPSHQSST